MKKNFFNDLCLNRIKSSLTKKNKDLQSQFSMTNPNIIYQVGEMKPRIRPFPSQSISPHYRNKTYKRGENIERNYYRELQKELSTLEKSMENLTNMNEQELFDYKQTYISNFLKTFIEKLEEQCEEKSEFMKNLWTTFLTMFQNLFDRIITEIRKNQTKNLKDSVNVHKSYQAKIQNLEYSIRTKNDKIQREESYIKNFTMKYQEKKKKNKELAQIMAKMSETILEYEERAEKMKESIIELFMRNEEVSEEKAKQFLQTHCNYVQLEEKVRKRRKKQIKDNHKKKLSVKKSDLMGELLSEMDLNTELEKENIQEQKKQKPVKKQTKNYKAQVNLIKKKVQQNYQMNFSVDEKYTQLLIKNRQVQTYFKEIKKQTKNQGIQCEISVPNVKTNGRVERKMKSIFQNKKIEKEQPKSNSEFSSEKLEQKIVEVKQQVKNIECQNIQIECVDTKMMQELEMKKNKRRKPKYWKNTKKSFENSRISQSQQTFLTKQEHNIHKNSTISRQSVRPSREIDPNLNITNGQMMKKSKLPQKSKYSTEVLKNTNSIEKKNSIFASSGKNTTDEKNIFKLQDLLGKIKKCPINSKIQQAVKAILEKNLEILKNHNYFPRNVNKGKIFLQKIQNKRKSVNRISYVALNMRQITKILSKVYDKGFSCLKNKSETINMLQLLKEFVEQQYPIIKESETQSKILGFIKSFQVYSLSSFLVKNFLLLTSLQEKTWSSMVFSDDIRLYFILLKELNAYDQFQIDLSYTTVKKLKKFVNQVLPQMYRNQSLINSINLEIMEKLSEQDDQTKLDIYKCCQLILENVLESKLNLLKSLTIIISKPEISPNALITEEILTNILNFLFLPKLRYLHLVKLFRKKFHKNQNFQGIDLASFVNFCFKEGISDFQTIIGNHSHFYQPEISEQTIMLDHNYKKISKISKLLLKGIMSNKMHEKICLSLCDIVEKECCTTLQEIMGDKLTNIYIWSTCELEKKENQGY